MSRYQLWHEKKGNLATANLDADERIQAGKFMEAGAIAWANSKWGTDFYQPHVYFRHNLTLGMGCTPDALSGSSSLMAQVKIVDSLQFSREWDYEGSEITRAPLHILLQVQHELECAEKDHSWLIVLVGGNRLYRMICMRDRNVGK